MIAFINLFVVPFISVYIAFQRGRWPEHVFPAVVVNWGVFVAINSPFTKLLCKLILSFFNTYIDLNQSEYTLLSIFIAIFSPLLLEFVRKYVSVQVEIVRNEKEAHS